MVNTACSLKELKTYAVGWLKYQILFTFAEQPPLFAIWIYYKFFCYVMAYSNINYKMQDIQLMLNIFVYIFSNVAGVTYKRHSLKTFASAFFETAEFTFCFIA